MLAFDDDSNTSCIPFPRHFFRFPKISKSNQNHSNINQIRPGKFLSWKNIIGLNPCMVPYVYGQAEHASVSVCLCMCVCVCGLWVHLHIYSKSVHNSLVWCVLYLHICVHSCYVCATKRSLRQVCVCVCLCVGCCGWAGWGERPWCGCLCATSTHGDGGMRLHASPKKSGNLLCVWVCARARARVCICASVCVCTVGFLMGWCDHTDHYVFVCHDDGLGIFALDTRNSCPANPKRYTAITVSHSGNISLFHCMHMDFSVCVYWKSFAFYMWHCTACVWGHMLSSSLSGSCKESTQ